MQIRFSTHLKTLREDAGLTQAQLAEKLHTTQRKISYWESGKIEPDLEALWSIADFFELSIDELLGRTNFS